MEPTILEIRRACPLCGGGAFTPFAQVLDHSVSKEQFLLIDCLACGFRVTEPRPSTSDIGRYYQSEEYISHTNSTRTFVDRLYQFARRRALITKHRTIRRHQATGSILDIGCGTGEFLEYMRSKGYQVRGIEPEAKARSLAVSNHGLEVLSSMDDLEQRGRYDVITLWHVLEHVHEPRQAFQRLSSLLAPGGLLFIAVPDRESWDCSYYGALWAAWDVPRHLSHFRQQDIERLISDNQLQLVAKRRMWLDAPYVSMLSEKHLGRGVIVTLLNGAAVGLLSNLVSLFVRRASSSTLFIARRH